MKQKNAPSRNSEKFEKKYNPVTDTLVYALGGLGEVGKNMYCIEQDNEIIIIDAGVRFPEESLLGVDYVIPDFNHLIKNPDKKKVLIITHGHEDHIGGIPFLLKAVKIDKIYAPRFAKFLIEKKLEEKKSLKEAKIIEIDDSSQVITDLFTVDFFNVVHSIPDCLGVIVRSQNGIIVQTGDFKFDFTPVGKNPSYSKMASAGEEGVTLLMSDSTNSEVPAFSISEQTVGKQLLNITKRVPGRLIIATFASNVHRVQQIIDAAIACNRKIAVFGRSMENVVETGRKLGHIKISEKDLIHADRLQYERAHEVCIICTGSQGEPMAALSRVANGTHKYIKVIPGDTVVFSSSPIPGNALSVNRTVNALTRAGANVLTNSILSSLHTTGHASQEEQKLMLQLIKPEYFMPVHGEHKMQKIHAKTAEATGVPTDNIFICSNGDALVLRNKKVFLNDRRILADDIYVDGNDSSGLSTAVLKDRKILADNGLVSVILTIDSRHNKILSKPNIVSRGFVYIKDSKTLLKEAELIVLDALTKKMKHKTTFSEIKNCIKETLEPFLYKKTQRNPIIVPVILNHKDAMRKK